MYASLNEIICARQGNSICFTTQDLKTLDYPDETFDAIYCISVLEHTDEYKKITSQLCRVLERDGLIGLTMDISLDSIGDLPSEKAEDLISVLSEKLLAIGGVNLVHELHSLNPRKVLTTSFAHSLQRKMWPNHGQIDYFFRHLLRPDSTKIPFGNLTVFCALLSKT